MSVASDLRESRSIGDREYQLRSRFAGDWRKLAPKQKLSYIQRAFNECGMDSTGNHGEFVLGLIDTYAWTLFAEECDPDEAKAIRNAGWVTMENVNSLDPTEVF